MILEAAWGLREIKKPLAVCGDTPEMNKKLLLPLLFFTKDVNKEKWDNVTSKCEVWKLPSSSHSKVECSGNTTTSCPPVWPGSAFPRDEKNCKN